MVKKRTRIALSVASGLAAAAIALLYASGVRADAERVQKEAIARYGGELTSVCVATRDIEPGDRIDEGCVRVEEWVSSLLPRDAVTSLAKIQGKSATSRIPERAVISPVYFEERADGIDVPRGKVAVSVACDAEHALGGSIDRGDEVDVYVSKDGVADRLTRAVVLDTSSLANGGGDLAWATLAVGPEEVAELLAARSRGAVTLVLPGEAVEVSEPSTSDKEDERPKDGATDGEGTGEA